MEDRRWEDMKADCLAQVFKKVGLESLLLDVPFVCKSWHKASLPPECYKILDFLILEPNDDFVQQHEIFPFRQIFIDKYGTENFSDIGFMKFVMRRSCKSAVEVVLPPQCMELELIDVLLEECPSLKKLSTLFLQTDNLVDHFSKTVGGFKLLESLHLQRLSSSIDGILKEVGLHCKNLVSFSTLGCIGSEEALAIVAHLPNIKRLALQCCIIDSQELIKVILRGCKQLEVLDASNCCGFIVDDEIMKLSSPIKHVNFTNVKQKLFELTDEQREILMLEFEMQEINSGTEGYFIF